MERLQDIVTTRRRKLAGHVLRLFIGERKTCIYGNVLGARRRQKKDGEAEEDMAKHFQRRPGRDWCRFACTG